MRFGTFPGRVSSIITPRGGYTDGSWHHVVATQSAAGMALYLDGELAVSNTNPTPQAYSGTWRIGCDNLNGWPDRPARDFYAGDLDNAAVYGTPLTPARVSAHWFAA